MAARPLRHLLFAATFPIRPPIVGPTARAVGGEKNRRGACEREQNAIRKGHGPCASLNGDHILRWQIFKCVEDKAGDFYFMCIFNLNDGRGAFGRGLAFLMDSLSER